MILLTATLCCQATANTPYRSIVSSSRSTDNPGSVAGVKLILKGSRKTQASCFAASVMFALSLAGNTQNSSALRCCRMTSCTAHYLQDKVIKTTVHTSTATETATLMRDE